MRNAAPFLGLDLTREKADVVPIRCGSRLGLVDDPGWESLSLNAGRPKQTEDFSRLTCLGVAFQARGRLLGGDSMTVGIGPAK